MISTLVQKKINVLIAALIFFSGTSGGLFLRAQQVAATTAQGADSFSSTNTSAAVPPSAQDMAKLLRLVTELQQQLKNEHEQVDSLRSEVRDLRAEVASGSGNTAAVDSLKAAVDELHDDHDIVQSQVKTLQQTKVETESKYPITVTGMILFNSFVVDGAVDNPALPLIALARNQYYVHHSLGGSLQQTQLGLSAIGPRLWGAHTSADFSTDFFNQTNYTAVPTVGDLNLRLRTADVNVDWDNTQVSGGLQTPLISLLSPTSFTTVSEPALSWSGNLWTWLPQMTIEQRIPVSASSRAVFGFGLLDPTTSNILGEQTYGWLRRSLQPGYEARASYQWGDTQRPYEIGVNGYYTRQLYTLMQPAINQALDFWAGTADWHVPLARFADLSGEFYRGRGIGDLGGGAFKNIVLNYTGTYPRGLDSTGGWSQLKAALNRLTEVNVYAGIDSAEADEVRDNATAIATSPYFLLTRNRTVAANLIFRPQSYLVFSGEYRNLRSWYVVGPAQYAQTLSLTMGYIF